MTTEQDNLREALSAAYPASEVPNALRQRISALAEGGVAARQPWYSERRRAVLRLAGVAATVAAVAFLLFPRTDAAQAFQRMTDSLKDVRSAHYVVWTVLPSGSRVRASEVWYQAGKWRIEDADAQSRQVQVVKDGVRWTYKAQANTVTQDRATFSWEQDGVSGFSVGAILRDGVVRGDQNHVMLLGETTVAGRPAHVILLYSQWEYDKRQPTWRSRITVDDATDLPIRSEDQYRKPAGNEWQTTQVCESQYNFAPPPTVFTADFPKTARLINAVAEREEWRERLSRGIAAQKVTLIGNDHGRPTTVVIRDFQVNAKGDAFLLFTANTEVGRDIPFGTAELTDEFGTKCLDPSLQNDGVGSQVFLPTCMDMTHSGPKVNGYVFGGEQLEGIRWIPLQRQIPWKPRHFKLTLHIAINTVEGQGGTAVFDLPVQKAECEVVPEYMPYVGRPLSGDAGVQEEEEITARAYYLYHVERDLPQALADYRELIAIRSGQQKKSGASFVANSDEWFAVYQILNEMGRMEEAKAALLRARQDNDAYVSDVRTHDKIRSAMKELGMAP